MRNDGVSIRICSELLSREKTNSQRSDKNNQFIVHLTASGLAQQVVKRLSKKAINGVSRVGSYSLQGPTAH